MNAEYASGASFLWLARYIQQSRHDSAILATVDTDVPFDGPIDDTKEVAIKKVEPEFDEPIIVFRPFDDIEK